MEKPTARRRSWPFYLAIAAILAALPAAYLIFLSEDEQAAPSQGNPAQTAPARASVELKIADVQGEVLVRRSEGGWGPAAAGDPLRRDDAVRTKDGAYAVLIGGEAYEVKMEPGTEISVGELTDSISQLLLGQGMATATVKAGGRHTFAVKAKGSDAEAKIRDGAFSISNNGQGTVAVGVREGEVELFGGGKSVIVRPGQQSTVLPGQAPSEPAQAPTSLLLRVQWPKEAQLRKQKVLLRGQVDPGGVLSIAGVLIHAGADGHFEHPVVLKEGKNAVEVRVKSLTAEDFVQTRELEVDTTPPRMGLDRVNWE